MHQAFVHVCSCMTIAEMLIRMGYWPNNPVNPNMAFKLDLLAFMRALLLESQVSTKAFVESYRVVNQMSVVQVCIIVNKNYNLFYIYKD